MPYKIDAVFVLYRPNVDVFVKSLKSIRNQVETIYVIDNSTDFDFGTALMAEILESGNVKFLRLGKNSGIAAAQNIGIQMAIDNQADLTLLSDQDTLYPHDYVEKMLANYCSIKNGATIAAIGPDFVEEHRGGESEGFFVMNGISSIKQEAKYELLDVQQIIASGMIVNNKALMVVGMMDERLFIDWVDFEWCWRARSMGYRIIGCGNVVIHHTLGDAVVSIFGRNFSLHSPERNYYIIRNGISIALKKKYLSARTRFGIFLKSIRYMIAFILIGGNHFKNMAYCSRGFFHGITGQLGPLKNEDKWH